MLQNGEDESSLINSFEEANNYKVIIRDNLGSLKYFTRTFDERKDSIKVRIMHQIMPERRTTFLWFSLGKK